MLLTLRLELLLAELERLDVAGATLLTDEPLLDCCDTLRVELLPEVDTLRVELLPELATLRLELEPAETLRLELEPAETLRLSLEVLAADLEAMLEVRVTLRLELEPNEAERLAVELRLRFLSQPPPFILRLGLYSTTLSCPLGGAGR